MVGEAKAAIVFLPMPIIFSIVLEVEELTKTLKDLKVGDVMEARLWEIPVMDKDTDILHVLVKLSTRDHVWIVESKEELVLVGVVTEHDIMRYLVPSVSHVFFGHARLLRALRHASKRASQIMSQRVIKIARTATVWDALRVMLLHGIRRLPVVEGRRLVGELTLHQIIRLAAKIEFAAAKKAL
jgi:CBS domain-containing protein